MAQSLIGKFICWIAEAWGAPDVSGVPSAPRASSNEIWGEGTIEDVYQDGTLLVLLAPLDKDEPPQRQLVSPHNSRFRFLEVYDSRDDHQRWVDFDTED